MNSTFAEINLKNLQYNFNSIRKKTKTKVMAVVKADAYGHGMIECAKALSKLKNKPEYYGVALLDEAVELRNAKIINDPILCFAPFEKQNLKIYLNKSIIPSITTSAQINLLLKLKLKSSLSVHIKINTGMNRLGLDFSQALSEIVKLSKCKNIIIAGIYTHFATSDENDKRFAELQLKRFTELIDNLKKQKINYGLAHTANSGAILDMPNSYFDMVRPGIALYGYFPSLKTTESIRLKPVMSLYSKIATISKLSKGDSVGYGRLFTAKENIKCGTVPIGYADGLLRGLSNKLNVIIGNKLYPQIGRVSMDRISINLNNSRVKNNSNVTLIGKAKDHVINAWDWSKSLDTIPYEITCGISKRVPRKYVGKI